MIQVISSFSPSTAKSAAGIFTSTSAVIEEYLIKIFRLIETGKKNLIQNIPNSWNSSCIPLPGPSVHVYLPVSFSLNFSMTRTPSECFTSIFFGCLWSLNSFTSLLSFLLQSKMVTRWFKMTIVEQPSYHTIAELLVLTHLIAKFSPSFTSRVDSPSRLMLSVQVVEKKLSIFKC